MPRNPSLPDLSVAPEAWIVMTDDERWAEYAMLRAECDRYRDALKEIRDFMAGPGAAPEDGYLDALRMQDIAYAALDQEEGGGPTTTSVQNVPVWARREAILAGAKAFYRTQREAHDDIDMPAWEDADYHEACAAIHVAILVIGATHGYHFPDTSEGRINELLSSCRAASDEEGRNARS